MKGDVWKVMMSGTKPASRDLSSIEKTIVFLIVIGGSFLLSIVIAVASVWFVGHIAAHLYW